MKLTKQEIQFINVFDAEVNVNAKGCHIEGNTVTYLVDEKNLGQAIGRNGSNVRRLREKLGKNVEIIPFEKDAKAFLEKSLAIFKVKVKEVKEREENGKTIILKLDAENREKILRNVSRLKRLKAIIKKNFEIENIKLL